MVVMKRIGDVLYTAHIYCIRDGNLIHNDTYRYWKEHQCVLPVRLN
jgi:hypothetical protein